MAVELATGYVSIIPSAKGFKERLGKELDIDQPAERAGQSAGNRITSALGKAIKGTIVGVGVAAGAALSTALVRGWGRLTAIEEAQSKLQGLGHSAKSVQTIMDNALASVRGTAFGLDEAATVAASAVAAGIKPGIDLERVLKTVADTSSIAGVSMAEMGAIFNKVAASNRLTMGEVNQLADRGVPILQMLADQYGVTAEEMSKMVSRGEVDFPAFAKAIEANIGGAALESGNTTRGAFANMGAAAGRFGAALLEGLFPLAKEVFGGITTLIDRATEVAKPWADEFSSLVLNQVVPAAQTLLGDVGELAGKVREFLGSAEFEKIKTDTLDRLGSIFSTLAQTAKDVAPAVGAIIASLAVASGAIGVSTWELLLATLDVLAQVLATVLVPALTTLADWMSNNQGAVTAIVGAYAAWHAITVAKTAALKVKAAWVAINTARTKALAAAQKVARGATVAWNAAIAAGRWTAAAAQLAVMRTRTLAVAAAQKVARGATVAWNATVAATRWAAATAQLVAYRAATLAVSAATKVWTGIQWLFNAAMSANPIALIVVAIVALVAGIVVAYKKSETFRNIVHGALRAVGAAATWLWENAIKPAWEGIKKAFEVVAAVVRWWWENVTKRAFDAVVAAAKWLWDKVKAYFGFWKGVFDAVRDWVTGAVDWVRDKFNDVVDFVKKLPGRIRSAASGMWNGIKDAFRSAINWVIDKWNGLSFTLPSVDLGPFGSFGGGTFRVPQIPRLAKGGIVPATPGGQLVVAGEGGQAEAIIPLDRLERMLAGGSVSAGPDELVLDLDLGEGIREVVRVNLRERDRQVRRRVMAGTGRAR